MVSAVLTLSVCMASGLASAETQAAAGVVAPAAPRASWAFEPPRSHPPPAVGRHDWPRRRLDAFILARLELAGLQPARPAAPRVFIRRLSFDLTGLPPAPEEAEAYAGDPSPTAAERLVERLLDSPHFGERWARLWLDVGRYAEDQAHIVGNDRSLCYPNAFLYRDWVVGALNDDLSYPRFIALQLAADILEGDGSPNLAALGFLGLGPKYYDRGKAQVKADEWEDRVDVVCRGLLGLTVACARCHDHKFDPIPTEDYYALAGIFASTEMYNRPLDGGREMGKEGQAKSPADAMHIVREGKPQDLNVFVRGNPDDQGALVPRRFLRARSAAAPAPFTRGSGRLELAEAIARPENPLAARVLVNRIWAQCFGRPLVGTPSNFGALGEAPSHPELLDDLAVRFMENGWSLKWLLREIVLSATYRQGSAAEPAALEADPENRLLGRMSRRRLGVEAWRDALLGAAGILDPALGGPSLDPLDPKSRRRTLYSSVSRLELNRLLALFDYPDPNVHAEGRAETTTPLQKLFILDSDFLAGIAAAFADRLRAEGGADDTEGRRRRIARAYELCFARAPGANEVELGLRYLEASPGPEPAWRAYAQALLLTSEMLFID